MGKQMRPAITPEADEQQMISLAMSQARRQLMEGTAPAAVVTHFLKLASTREVIDRRQIETKIALDEAKVDSIKSSKYVEELYSAALDAMRGYSSRGDRDD